jgi:hypothetical protein
MADSLSFDEIQIQRMFGHEAAEDENIDRLREYYFKTSTYDQVITNLPLRILVGHKGIGKSALFQVAMAEDKDNHKLAILIKPDDVLGLGKDTSDFLKTIRDWKKGLTEIITRKVFSSLGADAGEELGQKLKRFGGKAIECLRSSFKETGKLDFDSVNKLVVGNFLKTGEIIIYIDDLDRGWQGQREDILRISALLNAVRDFVTENKGLSFRISLRSDVYFLVRTSDESTDKIEGSVIWQTWNNHEIFVLLIKRIESFFGRTVNEPRLLATPQKDLAKYLYPIMEPRFQGFGLWENAPIYRVLMSLIRKRPRDLVKLCTLAGRNAREHKNTQIQTSNFQNIFEEYSQGRLQDTVNEFRSELPSIERLLLGMRPSKKERTTKAGYMYKTDSLFQKISNICEMGQFQFSNGTEATTKDLAAFMYKINFLTARKEMPQGIVRKYFEENRYLSSQFVDFGFDWEIHPAYRWALQPENINNIFRTLDLTADEK